MTGLDAGIVAAFVVYSVASGLRYRRQASQGLEEYFLAGRSLPGWAAGASMAATQFAADTPLVVTGLIATRGVFHLWQFWSYGLAFLLLGTLFAPLWRRARVLTDAEFCELRYSGRPAAALRTVRALLYGTLFNCVVLAMVLFAATLIAESFLPWDQWLPTSLFETAQAVVASVGVPLSPSESVEHVGRASTNNLISILVITGFTLAYSATGGLRSVVATDVVQLAIMLVATALFAWFALAATDAWPPLLGDLVMQRFPHGAGDGIRGSEILALSPMGARDVSGTLILMLALQWLLQRNADGTGYLAQRAMACRSDADARFASLLFAFLQVVLRTWLWVPLGLALLLVLPPDPNLSGQAAVLDRERSYILGMAELLPPGALGLMLTAMLAALASTVDTHLNWGASYWANDLYGRLWCRGIRRREPSPRALVRVARLANGLILVLALGIMTHLGSVQEAWRASLVLGAGLGPGLVLRWLWWRVTAWGEIAALIATTLLTPVVFFSIDDDATRLLAMASLSTVALVAASLATTPTDAGVLVPFYERVRPPGWWEPVRVRAEVRQDARSLLAILRHTALAALGLFGLLLAGLLPMIATSSTWRPSWIATATIGVACGWAAVRFGRSVQPSLPPGRQ